MRPGTSSVLAFKAEIQQELRTLASCPSGSLALSRPPVHAHLNKSDVKATRQERRRRLLLQHKESAQGKQKQDRDQEHSAEAEAEAEASDGGGIKKKEYERMWGYREA